MPEQDNTILTWFKVMKTMVDSNVENLTRDENGWLMGECLQAYMENRDLPFPENCSPVLRYAARALKKEVDNSLKALHKRREDGQAGGNKKAENAREKAKKEKEEGIFVPPKITAFKKICAAILEKYGNKNEQGPRRFSLKLTDRDRKELFEYLHSHSWTYCGITISNNSILEIAIFTEAICNYHYSEGADDFADSLLQSITGLVKCFIADNRDLYLPALVNSLSDFVEDNDRIIFQSDKGEYKTAKDYYKNECC